MLSINISLNKIKNGRIFMWIREKKKLSVKKPIKYIICALIIAAVIVFILVKEKMFSRESKPEIISKSTLEKVINVSDL